MPNRQTDIELGTCKSIIILSEREENALNKQDFIYLIEVSDALEEMDRLLGKLTGTGHSTGSFTNLDKIYEVLLNNSHHSYKELEETEQECLFYNILLDMKKTPSERADILLKGMVK